MEKNDMLKTGTLLALGTACISGFANFINKIGVRGIGDPIVYTTLKNVMVAALLLGVLVAMKKRKEIMALRKDQMLKLLAVGVFGGALPFALYFTGLAQTSALNAALIHKTLFIWVLLLSGPFLRERLAGAQWLGIAAIFFGNLFVGGFSGFHYNLGELMILGATLFWAVESIIAKKVLNDVSSAVVATARMTIGSLVLLPLALARGGWSMVGGLTPVESLWSVVAAVLLLAYVVTWYSALKRAPASYVAALLVPATLVTNVLSAVFVTHAFTPNQAMSGALFVAGVAILLTFAKKMRFPRREGSVETTQHLTA